MDAIILRGSCELSAIEILRKFDEPILFPASSHNSSMNLPNMFLLSSK